MPVKVIASKADWDKIKNEAEVFIVDFTATWCGPCKMIGPIFVELSEKYPKIQFVKVDVDVCEDVASECGVNAMPTFHVYKKGVKDDEMVGANKDGLEALLQKYSA